ncbi:MAG: 2-oxo-4-hydroxy-4-carboxy-5-ureidoimidazoline decarboxylase [Gemmatimonadales bacterium]
MRRISDLPDAEAAAELAACCASARWVARMLSQRPFKDRDEVFESADRIWRDLAPEDWHEAFRAHPRIGERASGTAANEQSSMQSASDDVRAALAGANAEYEKKFGWIYIVCAIGKSPEEMLAMCRARMANDSESELKVAAEEQLKITKLRLEKLLTV